MDDSNIALVMNTRRVTYERAKEIFPTQHIGALLLATASSNSSTTTTARRSPSPNHDYDGDWDDPHDYPDLFWES